MMASLGKFWARCVMRRQCEDWGYARSSLMSRGVCLKVGQWAGDYGTWAAGETPPIPHVARVVLTNILWSFAQAALLLIAAAMWQQHGALPVLAVVTGLGMYRSIS